MAKFTLLLLCLTLLTLISNSQEQKCNSICEKINNNDCVVCYKKCKGTQGNKIYESFEFQSCKRKACLQKREISQTDQNGIERKQQYCSRTGYTHIPEDICILECCNDHSYTKFTESKVERCVEKYQDTIKVSKTIEQGKSDDFQISWVWIVIMIVVFFCCCCGSRDK